MKIEWCAVALAVGVHAGCPGQVARRLEQWQPYKVSHAQLAEDSRFEGAVAHELEGALIESGVVAIEIPGFSKVREAFLAAAHACVEEGGAASARLADGTVRRSLAARRVGGFKAPLEHFGECAGLDAAADVFRDAVWACAHTFGERLSAMMTGDDEATAPLLRSVLNEDYATVAAVLERGEHLEHFHTYRKKKTEELDASLALDAHTDQGLFVAFAPALSLDGAEAARFAVELRDGATYDVDLERLASCVVIMLGDGAEQFLNGRRVLAKKAQFRSVPHSLEMRASGDRAWFGLMVLAPADALEPTSNTSYGELRRLQRAADALASTESTPPAVSAACSRSLQRVDARELAACAVDELYCWYRCMPLVNRGGFAVSDESCGADDMRLNCTDPFGQPSDGLQHGDFYPACTDLATATHAPTLAPVDSEKCDGAFAAFEQKERDAGWFGAAPLVYAGRSFEAASFTPLETGTLYWNVTNVADGFATIKLKRTLSGRFGWSALGLANSGGLHNGMNGAPVLMAIHGGNALGPAYADVNQFRIDDDLTPFRTWGTAQSTDSSFTEAHLEVHADECYVAYELTVRVWGGLQINASECHDLIWASSVDTKMADDPLFLAHGYHESRGHLSLNFLKKDGACGIANATANDDDAQPAETHEATDSATPRAKGLPIAALYLAATTAAYLTRTRH